MNTPIEISVLRMLSLLKQRHIFVPVSIPVQGALFRLSLHGMYYAISYKLPNDEAQVDVCCEDTL